MTPVVVDKVLLPLIKSISLSLEWFLSSENLTGDNKWFCSACNGFMSRTRENKNVDSESVLILQLLPYDNVKSAVIKNTTRVNCGSETMRLSISGDRQVCLFKRFNLKTTRNHFETLQTGRYWVHISDEDNCGWLECNDRSVKQHWFKQHLLCFLLCNYLTFCIVLQGSFTSCLIFGCDVPTYNPSLPGKSTLPT